MKRIFALILVGILGIIGAAASTPAASADSVVTVNHLGWPNRSFSIVVNNPVVLTWAGVSDAYGSGGCVVDHGTSSIIIASYSATCSGPGAVSGETQIYADPDCIDGTWLYKMLVVAADGVVVFDDRAHGDCVVNTTTTTISVPPTTTIAPPPTTLVPGTRYCVRKSPKGGHACLQYGYAGGITTTT